MKVLIISNNPFSKVLNNGKTFESIFSSFDKSELFQLFFRPMGIPYDDYDYCQSSYSITDIDVLNRLLLRSKKVGGIVDNSNIVKEIKAASRTKKKLKILRDFLWETRIWKTPELINWYRTIKPDCIFLACGNMSFPHSIARYISKDMKIPLLSYFGDDYLLYPKHSSFFDKIQHCRTKNFYLKTVTHSALCFGIGDSICEEYSKYFNKSFTVLRTPCTMNDYAEEIDTQLIVISYFGGLHLGRWEMICRLAEILNTKCILNVYTFGEISTDIKTAFKKSNVKIFAGVSNEKLLDAMHKSTVLLHVESDKIQYRSLTRLSVSTKIPEYLNAGRIILGFGPPEVASMKILSENDIGLVIPSECTISEISKLIQPIFSYDIRKRYSFNARKYMEKYYERSKIANTFRLQLESLKK